MEYIYDHVRTLVSMYAELEKKRPQEFAIRPLLPRDFIK